MMDEWVDGGCLGWEKREEEGMEQWGKYSVRKTKMGQEKKSCSGHPIQITIKAFPFDSLFFFPISPFFASFQPPTCHSTFQNTGPRVKKL